MHEILRNKANQGGEFLNTENNKIIKETEHDSRKEDDLSWYLGMKT